MLISLQNVLSQLIAEFDQIGSVRRNELIAFGEHLRQQRQAGGDLDLIFICTHNSRRSHIARIWAQTAARHYGIHKLQTWSGGTQATAFNPRAVAAMRRAGFQIQQTTRGDNPIYHLTYAEDCPPLTAFSKIWSAAPNPSHDFVAVLTCGQADEACPMVAGASARFFLGYEDPKQADNTAQEAARYDSSVREIGREILFACSLLK